MTGGGNCSKGAYFREIWIFFVTRETEVVRKQKFGNGNTEVRKKPYKLNTVCVEAL